MWLLIVFMGVITKMETKALLVSGIVFSKITDKKEDS